MCSSVVVRGVARGVHRPDLIRAHCCCVLVYRPSRGLVDPQRRPQSMRPRKGTLAPVSESGSPTAPVTLTIPPLGVAKEQPEFISVFEREDVDIKRECEELFRRDRVRALGGWWRKEDRARSTRVTVPLPLLPCFATVPLPDQTDAGATGGVKPRVCQVTIAGAVVDVGARAFGCNVVPWTAAESMWFPEGHERYRASAAPTPCHNTCAHLTSQ